MKKLIPLVVGVLVIACLPTTPIPGAATPTAVIQATPTLVPTLTETLLPSETPVLLDPSATPIVESPVVASPSVESTATASPLPNLTSTVVTSTNVPGNTASPTLAPGQPTLTPTLGILKYGTLPPAVPFNSITLWNRSKRQAYISLQVTTVEGYFTIIEYPVEGQVKIKAPLGSYVYVAWVGGNKMTGTFRLTSTDSLVITLFKDKVTVK
ncbi:MAG: hypothetical protein DCC56_16220 [Anaerolineae bacterium]|nr:MAG: hypothetical protein DCC56_16220 [Anaerolineae bacterium]WKZ42520.1 MAG: hypothetical protein QY302_10490 [Anaerolineales bacterium]WKZ48852.1 MAG: hypothetical protein QY306_05715 [Anaerolineales bacterium]